MARRHALALVALVATAAALTGLLLLRGSGATDADERGATVERIEIQSEAVGRTQPVTVVVPADAPEGERSGLVFLHGRGGGRLVRAADGPSVRNRCHWPRNRTLGVLVAAWVSVAPAAAAAGPVCFARAPAGLMGK